MPPPAGPARKPMSYGDLNGQWGVANEIMKKIQDLKQELQIQTEKRELDEQNRVKNTQTEQYHSTNEQLKRKVVFLNQRCQSWTTMLLTCTGLSDDTTTYLRQFEAQLTVGEDEPLGENGDLLEDMHDDLHEIEKGIQTVLDMENVSIDHLSTDMNPYIICPTI